MPGQLLGLALGKKNPIRNGTPPGTLRPALLDEVASAARPPGFRKVGEAVSRPKTSSARLHEVKCGQNTK